MKNQPFTLSRSLSLTVLAALLLTAVFANVSDAAEAEKKAQPTPKAAPAKKKSAPQKASPENKSTSEKKDAPEKKATSAPKKPPTVPLYDINLMQVAIVAFVVEVNEKYARDVGVKTLYNRNIESLGNLEVDEISSTFLPNITTGLDLILEDRLSDGSLVSARIKALLEQDKAEIRTRPIVITMHKKKAIIETVDEIPFQDVKFNKNGAPGLAVTYEKVGIKLDVTPTVLEPLAKELVELNLHNIEISSLTQFNTINKVNRPVFALSKASTKVVLHNKDTLVIGGLKSRREVLSEDRVPYIGRIPLLGWLFKYHRKEMRDNDIFILITPHILPPGTNPILPYDFKRQEVLDEPLANPSVGNMFE